MGNRYNHNYIHHKSTFLPMLCSKPSIKDVVLPRWEDRSDSFSDDPLSPKVGCMGQVKRSNKVDVYPTSHKLTITNKNNNNVNVKYNKLKRLFSSRNLTTTTAIAATTTAATTTATSRCRSRRQVILNGAREPKIYHDGNENCISVINIVEMDPPLPVIRKVKPADGGDADSTLWKRRSGGHALKSLQLQQIHHPRHHLEPTTV